MNVGFWVEAVSFRKVVEGGKILEVDWNVEAADKWMVERNLVVYMVPLRAVGIDLCDLSTVYPDRTSLEFKCPVYRVECFTLNRIFLMPPATVFFLSFNVCLTPFSYFYFALVGICLMPSESVFSASLSAFL